MVTDRKIESSRRNASRSTGPKTKKGKERSSHNAVSHGLSASPAFDAETRRRIEFLAKGFVQKDENDPVSIELAQEAAETQVMLERIRILKRQAWETAARNPVITDRGKLHELNDPVIFSVLNFIHSGMVQYIKTNMEYMMAEPFGSEQERDVAILEITTNKLSSYVRYERQAAKRRDRALQKLTERQQKAH